MSEEFSLGASVQAMAEQMVAAGIPATEHDVMAELRRIGRAAWATDPRLDLVLDEMIDIDREDRALAATVRREIETGLAWAAISVAHVAAVVVAFAVADLWGRGWI